METGSAPAAAPAAELGSLMSGYQQSDQGAAATFIERVSPLLHRYFLARSSDREYAEDLVQETWMRIHKARHTYRSGEPVLPWIFAIARHTGLDNYRKRRRLEAHERQVDVLPEPSAEQPAAGQTAPGIASILRDLPEKQREVLVMLKVLGMTIDEVATATSSSPGSVKQKAHRAYEKLRGILSAGAGMK
ncbi:MAG TPA: RNA polymerase sigma factor [Bryobacteraceae bacterium]|nr:RNA polymerase sigma factor [Bryobacteraceae bacterium]